MKLWATGSWPRATAAGTLMSAVAVFAADVVAVCAGALWSAARWCCDQDVGGRGLHGVTLRLDRAGSHLLK